VVLAVLHRQRARRHPAAIHAGADAERIRRDRRIGSSPVHRGSGFLAVFIFLVVVEVVLAVLVLVMGERTTKVSLEELNELGHTKLKGAA
jgi:ABC-type Fe3+ transport system permease subunit